MMEQSAAIFLDRDGVLIEDCGPIVDREQIKLLPGVAHALRQLKAAGFRLVAVTNQAVVARGLIGEKDLAVLHAAMDNLIERAGGPRLDAVYYCPHHPRATLPEFRRECPCRKPRPGMLLQAAKEHSLDLQASFMVGDRITDIAAGAAAGCRTVWVACGRHADAPIVTVEPLDPNCSSDHACCDLSAAADWILRQR